MWFIERHLPSIPLPHHHCCHRPKCRRLSPHLLFWHPCWSALKVPQWKCQKWWKMHRFGIAFQKHPQLGAPLGLFQQRRACALCVVAFFANSWAFSPRPHCFDWTSIIHQCQDDQAADSIGGHWIFEFARLDPLWTVRKLLSESSPKLNILF